MVDWHSLHKGKKVVMWLRFGYTFSKKVRVGYDLAWNDKDFLTDLIYDPHPLVSLHIHSADAENM